MQNVSFAADKPDDCSNCYFWKRKKGCSLGNENCYYQIRVPQEVKSDCDGCPYGREHPCIGWCTKKIMQELGIR